MADEESRQSARDRRRERAKSGGPDAATLLRRYRVHLVIVVLFGGIVAAMVVNSQQTAECPGHWHSTQDVFVHGERVSFNHPKFTLEGGQGMPVSSHMHRGDDAQMHFEPTTASTCVPYGDFLRFVDMDLAPGVLVLDGAHEQLGQAGTFRNGDNGTLSAEHCIGTSTSCEDWEPISVSRLLDRQLRPNERVLVYFGNGTADVEAMRAHAESHDIQSSSRIRGGSLVPAFGVGVIGLVVLGGWHALSRKA